MVIVQDTTGLCEIGPRSQTAVVSALPYFQPKQSKPAALEIIFFFGEKI